jgi:hypothetical protein
MHAEEEPEAAVEDRPAEEEERFLSRRSDAVRKGTVCVAMRFRCEDGEEEIGADSGGEGE